MAKYKHLKIKTIQDWNGEFWDVYIEYKTHAGIMVYRGWPYGYTARDEGISPIFSIILTPEIAVFLKEHTVSVVAQQLGLSLSIIGKFRRILGIQNKFIYRNDQWLLDHQNEILYDSLESLKKTYGLKRTQVYQHRIWLSDLIDLSDQKRLRKTKTTEMREQWFKENKQRMLNMTVNELVRTFDISPYIAKKFYNRIHQELGQLSFSKTFQQKRQTQHQWLLDNQNELLNSGKSAAILAKQFQKTPNQILRAKEKLRKILDTPKVKDENQKWLLAHQTYLLDSKLTIADLSKKLGLTSSQVIRKRTQLKKLLNLPLHNDQIQTWRLENQDILLSLHLSISEIACQLNRSEKYIVKNRLILRKFLNISIEDQKRIWVLQHQKDLEQLNIEQIKEKYQISQRVIKSYQKLLVKLKQNEGLPSL